jgi:hypothetical protein
MLGEVEVWPEVGWLSTNEKRINEWFLLQTVDDCRVEAIGLPVFNEWRNQVFVYSFPIR